MPLYSTPHMTHTTLTAENALQIMRRYISFTTLRRFFLAGVPHTDSSPYAQLIKECFSASEVTSSIWKPRAPSIPVARAILLYSLKVITVC